MWFTSLWMFDGSYMHGLEAGHGILHLRGAERLEGKWERGVMTHQWRAKQLMLLDTEAPAMPHVDAFQEAANESFDP